jgi:hypothetical protein
MLEVVRMGDIGIDKWVERMEWHKRKNHRIIRYATDSQTTLREAET